MEDIVKEVRAIKRYVALLAFAVVFIALGFAVQGILAFRFSQSYSAFLPQGGYYKTEFRSFMNKADELIAAGQNDALIAMANEQIAKRPDDPYGHYYLGLAYYNKADYEKAVKSLTRAAELAPTWKDKIIAPYLDAAESKLRGAGH